MENINSDKFNIFGLDIDKTSYSALLNKIITSINSKKKTTIGYANANTLNNIFNNPELQKIISSFIITHPDGIGVYLASRFLYGKKGINRMTGSDFYPLLIEEGIKNKWRFFFFGHDKKTLERTGVSNPELTICGYSEGYNFDTDTVIDQINNSDTNILVVGLGFPGQEKWIFENKNKLNCNVIIAVGDGIRVFSGTKKRGARFIRKLGFEWLIRIITNPAKYWKRYLIGNPVFLLRIIKLKLIKFNK